MSPTVHSFYRSNIAPEIIEAQAKVFSHFDVPLKQWKDDTLSHGDWVDQLMRDSTGEDTVVIADIDAFPLSRAGYNRMVDEAERGIVTGLAQVANHKDPNRIYAGPMFMATSRALYQKLGSPKMQRSKDGDVAQALTDAAQQAGVEVSLTYPSFAIQPRWALANRGVFGVGTFYGDSEFFHLFESRKSKSIQLFCAVADGAISGTHDFEQYLEIVGQAQKKKRKFLGLF
jgi:hypothetical protein